VPDERGLIMRIFSRLITVFVVILAAYALVGCGGDDDEAAAEETTVELAAVGDSGQTGTATLTPEGEQTRVVIVVDDPVSDSQPAHIHEGTCDDLNPDPEFGLPNVADGRSDTTVDTTLEDLTSEPYAINLHMSDDDLTTYTSCGNIQG
jgi:Cu/Zn superoxide dismutase